MACGCSRGREDGTGEAGAELPISQGVDCAPTAFRGNTVLAAMTRALISEFILPPAGNPASRSTATHLPDVRIYYRALLSSSEDLERSTPGCASNLWVDCESACFKGKSGCSSLSRWRVWQSPLTLRLSKGERDLGRVPRAGYGLRRRNSGWRLGSTCGDVPMLRTMSATQTISTYEWRRRTAVKEWSRKKKEALIDGDWERLRLLAQRHSPSA